MINVRFGSWLCENAAGLSADRMTATVPLIVPVQVK